MGHMQGVDEVYIHLDDDTSIAFDKPRVQVSTASGTTVIHGSSKVVPTRQVTDKDVMNILKSLAASQQHGNGASATDFIPNLVENFDAPNENPEVALD